MYRFHTGGHGSPKIATAMTLKKTANTGTNPTKPAKVEPRSTSSSMPPSELGGKTHRTNLSVLHFNGGQTFQPEKCGARRMGPGRKERLHLTQATRSAQCTMHLTQGWSLEVTMLGTFQEIDVIGVADCLVQMLRIYSVQKTPYPTYRMETVFSRYN